MRAALVGLLLLCASAAEAKTICVSQATGNDLTTYAAVGATTNCWQTLGRAVWGSTDAASPSTTQAAQAGDLVVVLEGTHASAEEATGDAQRWTPLYNSANSGTSGNVITYRCVADFAAPTVVSVGGCLTTASVHEGPLWGTENRDYVTWDGFRCDEAQMTPLPDTGCIVVHESANVSILNWRLDGITTAWGDNHQAVRVENSSSVEIDNGFATGVRDSLQTGNQPCVMFYGTVNGAVRRLTCEDSDTGVFIKALNTGLITIERSVFDGLNVGIKVSGAEHSANIHQNLILRSTSGVVFQGPIYGGEAHPVNATVCNNTIVTSGAGTAPIILGSTSTTGWAGLYYVANIASGGQWSIWGDDMAGALAASTIGPDPSAFVMEHNVYFGASTVFSRVGGSNRDFATWKTLTGSEAASPVSVESDPLFTDAGTDDYTLQSGSPARLAAPDRCDIDGDANTSETKDAGARQFADNGDPVQIGFGGSADPPDPDPPADPPQRLRPRMRVRMAGVFPAEQPWMMLKRRSSRGRAMCVRRCGIGATSRSRNRPR